MRCNIPSGCYPANRLLLCSLFDARIRSPITFGVLEKDIIAIPVLGSLISAVARMTAATIVALFCIASFFIRIWRLHKVARILKRGDTGQYMRVRSFLDRRSTLIGTALIRLASGVLIGAADIRTVVLE